METFNRSRAYLAVITALCTSLPSIALADEENNKDSKLNTSELETITVTATRHESSLMKTPLAMTALDQKGLIRQGINSLQDMGAIVPNLEIGQSVADSGVQASIRGVTSTNFTEIGDPSVSVHVNGFYQSRPQGSIAMMFDLERVEALRGPQGTLFGRNSPGGTINIITKKPQIGENSSEVMADFGNYNKQKFQYVGNLSLSENFAVRAAIMSHQRDGFVKQNVDTFERNIPELGLIPDGIPDIDQRYARDVGPEDSVTNANEWGARLSATYVISDDLVWDGNFEHYSNDSAGGVQLKDCDMAAGTRFACDLAQREVNLNVAGKLDMTIDSFRSVFSWDLNDNTNIEFKTSFQNISRVQHTDGDSGYHPLNEQVSLGWSIWSHDNWAMFTLKADSKNWVNELQLKQEFDSWRYVAGLFAMNEDTATITATNYEQHAPIGFPMFNYFDQPDRNVDAYAIFAQADIELAEDWTMTLGARQSWDKKEDKNGQSWNPAWDGRAWTADGVVGYYYNNQHTPPAGATLPHQSNDLTDDMGPFAGPEYLRQFGFTPSDNSYKASWSKFTWRAGLQYDLNDSEMLFSSVSTGYKSGGFGDKVDRCGGGKCFDGSEKQYTFLDYKPEEVTNYELGYRGNLLDGSLNLSATAFLMDYKNMQFTGSFAIGATDSDCTWAIGCELTNSWRTENIGQSEIKGLEAEFDFIPWDSGRISGYVSYLDTSIEEWDTYSENAWFCGNREEFGAPECTPQSDSTDLDFRGRRLYDVTGNQLPYASKLSWSLSAEHRFELDSGYAVVPWVSVRWKDDMYFTARNLDNPHIGDVQKAYYNVNASLKLFSPGGNWQAEVYGTNLTDELVKNWMSNDQADYITASFSPPRQYGARFTYHF